MKKCLFVLGVVLTLSVPALAGKIQIGSYTTEVTLEPFAESASGDPTDGSTVIDCGSEFQCQIESPEFPGTHQPVIRFLLHTPQVIHVQVGFWNDFDCPTEIPDQSLEGDVDFSPFDPETVVGIRIIFSDPGIPDGTTLAMEWVIDTCPASDCHNYTFGDPNDQCM